MGILKTSFSKFFVFNFWLLFSNLSVFFIDHAVAADCDKYIRPFFAQAQTFAHDQSLLLKSRFGPVKKTKRYEIRVLSQSLFSADFSANKLLTSATHKFNQMLDRYEELGFQQVSYIEILIEAKTRSLAIRMRNSQGPYWMTSQHDPASIARVSGLAVQIGIPNFLGGFRCLEGPLGETCNFAWYPVKMNLSVVNAAEHSLDYDFVIAHELAHVFELVGLNIWREARADFLSFAITGETELRLPHYQLLDDMDVSGEIFRLETPVVRSLAAPRQSHRDLIAPSLRAYHLNSQVISSALYRMSQRVGLKPVIDLVHWMDSRALEQPRDLAPINGLEKNTEGPIDHVVDTNDVEAVRSAIQLQLTELGQILRRASNELHSEVVQQVVDEELAANGI